MFGFEEVFQNHLLSLLFLRPPRHRVACDLIPLAVLKLEEVVSCFHDIGVACDLIPLAVLKHESHLPFKDVRSTSHVTSYRLRFAIQKESRSALFLYACFEAGIAFNGRTFFDTQKRLLSTLLQPKPPAFLVAMVRLIV